MTAPVRATVCSRRTRKVTSALSQRAETECAGCVAAPIGPPISRLRTRRIGAFFQQHAEIDGARSVAALICASERRLCPGEVSSVREYRSVIACRTGVTALIRATVFSLRAGHIPLPLELSAEVEGASSFGVLTLGIGRLIAARRPGSGTAGAGRSGALVRLSLRPPCVGDGGAAAAPRT